MQDSALAFRNGRMITFLFFVNENYETLLVSTSRDVVPLTRVQFPHLCTELTSFNRPPQQMFLLEVLFTVLSNVTATLL